MPIKLASCLLILATWDLFQIQHIKNNMTAVGTENAAKKAVQKCLLDTWK